MVIIEHAVQGLDQVIVPGPHPSAGQGGQLMRVALPGDHRLDHVLRRDRGQLAGHGRYFDQRAFQQLFQPLPAAGALLDQAGAHPRVITQVPDRARRHERGPQQPHLSQPGQPHRVQLVRFGPPGQVLRLGRVHQLHRQPARLQHEKPYPPVIGSTFQRYDLDAVVLQLAAQLADGAHPRLDRPHHAAPGTGTGRVRGAGAHHARVLRHVNRRHPLMHPLVLLVIDNLRFRLAHRSHLLCLTCGITAGCPGVPVGGHQARNTDRRAQGNSARPSGQDPSARLIDGFASQGAPASRAARTKPSHPHARTAAQTPAETRQRPPPPATRTDPDFHATRPSPRMGWLIARRSWE